MSGKSIPRYRSIGSVILMPHRCCYLMLIGQGLIGRPTIWLLPRKESGMCPLTLLFNHRLASPRQLTMTLSHLLAIEFLGHSK